MENIERDVAYWQGSPNIRSILVAMQNASTQIVLFLEYFPYSLRKWLEDKIILNIKDATMACLKIEDELNKTILFMKSHGLLHMDAHFENIMTEGNQLYFTDFGLALSTKFDLSKSEIEFFAEHQNYDHYSSVTNLLHSIITALYGKDEWIRKLDKCIKETPSLPAALQSIILQHAQTAFMMDDFYRKLQLDKNTNFPTKTLT